MLEHADAAGLEPRLEAPVWALQCSVFVDDQRRSSPRDRRDVGSVPPPVPAAPSTVIAGRYALGPAIGRGGCAIIYEARDLRLGRIVALKVLKENVRDAQAAERLAREVRSGAAIHHPNVCGIVDAGYHTDGRPFLVMERLHGETLAAYLGRAGRLTPLDAIDVAVQLLSALDAAHSIGIVHRDLKPDNVFLVPRRGCRPLVKLLDFGMCRRATPTWRDDATLTRAGQVVGTPEYMSPEQVVGNRAFDERIDIYAVGVILYEALCGRRAFRGKDPREVVVSVLAHAVTPLREVCPDVPVELAQIVAHAMDRDAASRYATALDFQGELLKAKAILKERESARKAQDAAQAEHGESDEWEQPTIRLADRKSSRRSA